MISPSSMWYAARINTNLPVIVVILFEFELSMAKVSVYTSNQSLSPG